MSFDDTAREPDQMFSLNHDIMGELEYPTKYVGVCSAFFFFGGCGKCGLPLKDTGL